MIHIYSFVLGMQDEHTLFSWLPPCCAIWSILVAIIVLVYVFQMNKCKLDYNARAMDCRHIWAMEHLWDEQIEEAQFQRDEEMADQMEQLIFNDARAGGDVDDYDFEQFLNDFGDGMESRDWW